ncbi:MAG: TRAM domain-containing protein, partial [Patescibacteria group bacterium]
PGTAAAKLEDDVPKQEKKRREEELMKVLRMTALENNKKYLGKVIEVLVEGISKDGGWYGKTRTGKVVKFRISDFECRIGEFVEVEIMEVEDFRLKGYVKGLSPNAVFGINS